MDYVINKKSYVGMTEKVRNFLKKLGFYTIISVLCVTSFILGLNYTKLTTVTVDENLLLTKITKKDVFLALDEFGNIMVVDKKTGKYTIYDDTVSKTVFNMYAKTIVSGNQ